MAPNMKKSYRKTSHPTSKPTNNSRPIFKTKILARQNINNHFSTSEPEVTSKISPENEFYEISDLLEQKKHGGAIVKVHDFAHHHIPEMFAHQGWLSLLSLNNKAYNTPMTYFYKNLSHKPEPNKPLSFHSHFVKDITFSYDSISKILKCPNEGISIINKNLENFDHYPKGENVESAALTLFGDHNKRVCSSIHDLTEEARIVAYIITNNIIPNFKCKNIFPCFHLLLVYCLIKGIKVHLPCLITNFMLNTMPLKLPQCYGKLITLLYAANGLSFEKLDPIKDDEQITADSLSLHQIILPNHMTPSHPGSPTPLDQHVTKQEFENFRKETKSTLNEILSYLKRTNELPTSRSSPPHDS